MFELKEELNSFKEDKKKDAVKKVIAAMTVGKDVSGLFTDVLNCIQTNNLELKKLVYLYLMNYAKTQPDRAILAVNTFVKVIFQIIRFIVFHFFLFNYLFLLVLIVAKYQIIIVLIMDRIRKIPTLLFAPLPSEPWAASAWTRLSNISASPCANHFV
jgi:hypothetical protein